MALPDILVMKFAYFSAMCVGFACGMAFSLVPSAEAHLVPPFYMQIGQNYTDPVTHTSFANNGEYFVVPKSSERSVPLIIKNDDNAVGIPVYFHTALGNNFGQEIMPSGILVRISPDNIVLNGSKEQRVTILVKASQDAIVGTYEQAIVARWVTPQEQQSVLGAIQLKIVNSPQEALAPLRQTASGVSEDNVVCNGDHVRIIKKESHERACVRPDSVADLVLRGWAENPLDDLLLRYTDSARADRIFYDIMNEPKVRAQSTTGWTYNTYDTAADGEHQKFSATIHLYMPPSVMPSHPECNYGMTALVVMNLKPLQIEHNYTEAGCVQPPNPFTDMGINLR